MRNEFEEPKPSHRKLAANRANAQKSTGPKTLKGKAISSQNGSKAPIFTMALAAAADHAPSDHAAPDYAAKDFLDLTILPGESRDEFAIVHQQFVDDFKPQSPTEIMIVEQMSRNHWNLLRLQGSLFYALRCQVLVTTQGAPSERVVRVISNAAGTRSFEGIERALTRAQRLRSCLIKDLDLSRRVRQEHAQSTANNPSAPGPLDQLPIRPSQPNIAQKNVRPNPPNESLILNFPRAPYTIALPDIAPARQSPSEPPPSAGGINEAP